MYIFLNFKLFKYDNFYIEIEFTKKNLLTTMLTIKILFTINSLKKKRKNYSFKNSIYNSCRFKKHLI